jgi:hypothetical protein
VDENASEPQTFKAGKSGRKAGRTAMNCEAEFLLVGDGCKAGDANNYEIMVIDGGNLDSGKAIVSRIQITSAITPSSAMPW